MDRKKDVIGKLRELDALRQAEQSLSRELELLELEEGDPLGMSSVGREGQDPPLQGKGGFGRRERLERALRRTQCRIEMIEQVLQVLDPEERVVADWLFVYPRKGNVQRLCQVLGVEQSSVYRKRDRTLRKLEIAMFGK